MDSSAASQEGQGVSITNGEMFKVLLSITVILDDPAKPGMLVDESPSRKVSEDAAWSRWDGNDEPRGREQQPSKAERPRRKHPLTVQP